MSIFMQKPNDWEEVRPFVESEPPEAGGHICIIKKIEEAKSRNGRDMIMIFLDIAEGKHKGYYAQRYNNDDREDKKWGCIVYQSTKDKSGNTNRGFKTFIESVAASNSGFDVNEIWNENFCEYFKDRLVGGIFGREQYRSDKDGLLKFAVKCFNFTTVERVGAGILPPPDRLIENSGFVTGVMPFSDVGLPF